VRPGSTLHERLLQSTRPRACPPTRLRAPAGPQSALEGQAAQVQQERSSSMTEQLIRNDPQGPLTRTQDDVNPENQTQQP
jgi:hypothetical protein